MAQQTFNNGDDLSVVRGVVNNNGTDAQSRFTSLEQPEITVIPVFSVADLPAPAGGIITLAANNVRYQLYNQVIIGTDRIVSTVDSVQIEGLTPDAGFVYTGTGNMLTTTATLQMFNVNLIGLTANRLIDAIDAGSSTILLQSMGFVGGSTTDLVCIEDYANVLCDLCGFVSGAKGIFLADTITNFTIKYSQFQVGVIGINIDLNGAVSAAIAIESCVSTLSASSTFLNAAVDSGNLTATGGGTITNNKIDDSAGGAISVGLSPLDARWLSIGNNNVLGSDRINPTGWGFYVDGDTVTQTVPALEANAIKFSVDGLGGASNSEYLPRVIRGISELWDIATDDIVPITIGDSFVARVAFTVTAKSSNPTLLTIVVDIGATGGVTIPVVETSIGTPNAFPRKVMVTIPLFSLATFIANNAQVLMYTDSGTLDIEERSIFIERASSGAS